MKSISILMLYFLALESYAFSGIANWSHISAPACSGATVGGGCWYFGTAGQDCTTICSTHGGYNTLTRTYAGDQGTAANCQAVMNAVGAPGTTVTDSGSCSASGGYYNSGCNYYTILTARYRCTNQPTLTTGTDAITRRVCACNN